jgi:peptide/nickel transport system substrate-binding protein
MNANTHTRRAFLRMSAFTVAAATLAACTQPTATAVPTTTTAPAEATTAPEPTATTAAAEAEPTATTEEAATTAAPSKYNESPLLAANGGEWHLPPVEERLPRSPVVTHLEKVGNYGGTIRCRHESTGFYGGDASLVGATYNEFAGITPNLQAASPNILKDWTVSVDFKTIDCYMRKGMKWSDGQPLTSDDFLLLMYEDWLTNTDLTPVVAEYFQPGGELMKLDIVDRVSFTLTFGVSQPSFVLVNMATATAGGATALCRATTGAVHIK